MAKTLLNFCSTDLAKGCVQALEKYSPVLTEIPVMEVVGSAHSFNVMKELVNAGWRTIDQDLGASQALPEKYTVDMKIAQADVKVDRSLTKMGDLANVRAVETETAMIAMAQKILDGILYGNAEDNSMNGLTHYIESGFGTKFEGTITGDVANVDTELEMIYEAIDSVAFARDGVTVIFVSPATHRKLNKLCRNANVTLTKVEAFGTSVMAFDNIPVLVDEAVKDGDIFIVKLGEQFVSLLSNGGLTAEDAGLHGVHYITAVEFIGNLCVKHPKAFALISAPAVMRAKK